MKKFRTNVQFCKVDEDLGLVMGFAVVCTVNGEPYFDLHGDYIPDHEMLKAATEFMLNSRVGKDMHKGDETGTVVFAFPWTKEIAEAFDYDEPPMTGLMIAMKPHSEEILQKYRDGTYTGFSIGGSFLEPPLVIEKKIVEDGDQFCVKSEDGKKSFGCYDTKKEALDRLAEVEAFDDED